MSNWHEKWPARLEKEIHTMGVRYPSLRLDKTLGGELAWTGEITTAKRSYSIEIVYPRDFPISSPRVYPLSGEPDELTTGLHRAPHTFADGSLCLAFPQFDSATVTAADVASGAVTWLKAFECYIETGNWRHPANKSSPTSIHIQRSTVGTVNLGNIAGDSDANISLETNIGEGRVRHGFRAISDAVASSNEIPENAKAELLAQIKALKDEASEPSEKRRGWLVSALVGTLRSSLSVTADVAQIWSAWGPQIARYFNLPI